MFKRLFVLFVSVLFLSLGCKQDAAKTSAAAPNGLILPLNIQKGGQFESVAAIRAQANAVIDSRIKNLPDPLAMITYGYWYPEFVFNSGNMSDEFEYLGFWVKFDENFEYTYGYYDNVLGGGRYHFRLQDYALIMLDHDESLEPKVWTAQNNGEAMALVGTHEFGVNNGMQIKMLPLDLRPKKS